MWLQPCYFSEHLPLTTSLSTVKLMKTNHKSFPEKCWLTVSMLCHKPASFLKSRTFTMVSPRTEILTTVRSKANNSTFWDATSHSIKWHGLKLCYSKVCCKVGFPILSYISEPVHRSAKPNPNITLMSLSGKGPTVQWYNVIMTLRAGQGWTKYWMRDSDKHPQEESSRPQQRKSPLWWLAVVNSF